MPLNLTETKLKLKIITAPAVFLLVIALIILIFLSFKSKNPEQVGQNQQALSTPDQKPKPGFVIPPEEARSELPDKVQNIKRQMIEGEIANDNGTIVLFISDDYKIVYVPTPDFFLATILKEPVDKNKKEAESWFLKFGLTQSDLCNLPVRFGLGSLDFKKANPDFSPLPDGCAT